MKQKTSKIQLHIFVLTYKKMSKLFFSHSSHGGQKSSFVFSKLSLCVFLTFVTFLTSSCSEKPEFNDDNRLQGQQYSHDAVGLYDPDEARLQDFYGDVTLAPMEGASKILVPTIDLRDKKYSTTFVRVLRCKEEYELRSSTGVPMESLDEITKYDDMKWIWNKASGDVDQCKFLGTHVVRDVIQDIAASSGSYFYVLNPCVSKKRSLRGKEGCSNDLKRTRAIQYESRLKSEFIRLASTLSEFEVEVAGGVEDVKQIAGLVMAEQRACEKVAAIRASNQSFWRGVASLASAVVGGVVGTIIGGPVGAVQGATSFMGLARRILVQFGPKVKLDCKAADKYREDLTEAVNRLEKLTDQVVVLRNKMAAAEGLYRRLDTSIKENNTNVDELNDQPKTGY